MFTLLLDKKGQSPLPAVFSSIIILVSMKVWHFWTSVPHIRLRKLSASFQRGGGVHGLNAIVNWGHSSISAHKFDFHLITMHTHTSPIEVIYTLPNNLLVHKSRNVWREKGENGEVTFWPTIWCSQQLLILWKFFVPEILPACSSVWIQFHCIFSAAAMTLLFWIRNLTLLLGEGWPCC